MNREITAGRVLLIDIARFYGLVLVYYGHMAERFMNLGDPTGARHYKFIYSFHMMLFFVLAGYVSRQQEMPARKFLKKTFFTRVLPLAFFIALNIAIMQFVSSTDRFVDKFTLPIYIWGIIRTIFGFPVFDFIMWFLYALVSVEVIHYFIFPYIRSNGRIVIAALAFYVGGYFLNLRIQFFKMDNILWNLWFLHEAVVMYAFYLLGILLSRWKGLEVKRSWIVGVCLVIASTLALYYTYDLNKGPFIKNAEAVIIVASAHGNIFFFPLTAVIGCLFILFLADITPVNKYVLLIGRNALIVFSLNGICCAFVDSRIVRWMYANLSHDPLTIFASCSVVTIGSLILSIPCIYLLNAYVPQLVGKPKVEGPVFKNFL